MLMVLVGHLQGDQIFAFSPYILPMCQWIFSFHMPFFFIVSGILLGKSYHKERTLSEEWKKLFRSVFLPYIWFSVIYLLGIMISMIISGTLAVMEGNLLLVNIWYFISGYGINVLWFLPALFLGEMLFLLLYKKLSGRNATIVIIVMTIAVYVAAYFLRKMPCETDWEHRVSELLTSLIRPFMVCGFIAFGFVLNQRMSSSNKVSDLFAKMDSGEYSKAVSVIFYLVLSAVFFGILTCLYKVNSGIDCRTMNFGNIPAYLVCAVSGSLGLLMLCKALYPIGIVEYWGRNSLIFMAVHNSKTILYGALTLSMYINQFLTFARGYICYGVVVLVLLLYTTLMIVIIRKFFPFLYGKPFVLHGKDKGTSHEAGN